MQRAALIADLERNREAILACFAQGEGRLDRCYAPGKWSAGQVLSHVCDVELVNLWRFLRAVAEPESLVEVFDENRWAIRLDYLHRPARVNRDLFEGNRGLLLHVMATAPDEVLQSSCRHPEKGEMSGLQWARLIIDHAEHHVG